MNIIGEGFHQNIINEIDLRHRIYGYRANSNLTDGVVPKVIDYLNSRTGWVRMVSSVNIKSLETINSPGLKVLNLSGDQLAKKFILFNGVGEFNNYNNRGGIMGAEWNVSTPINNILADNKAYGIGNTQTFGQSPMMGIISTNIKTETHGSLKTATIQIKAFNKVQFDIIDNLYLRLGYNILLEWGHSHYFKNTQLSDLSPNDKTLVDNYFGKNDYYDLLSISQQFRISSNGNYDALIGKVVNFNWTFNIDGSYDIVVILRSQGDIIESLKTNISLSTFGPLATGFVPSAPQRFPSTPQRFSTTPTQQPPPTTTQPNETSDQSTELGKLYAKCKSLLEDIKSQAKAGCVTTFYNIDTKDILRQEFKDPSKPLYYIRLGSLLKWMEEKLVNKVKFNNKYSPIIKFDYDLENNLIYSLGSDYSFSANPQVCLVKSSIVLGNERYVIAPNAEDFLKSVKNSSTISSGHLMNIYLNFDFLLRIFKDNVDKEGKVTLVKFLQVICEGINKSLGNVNILEPAIDESNGKIIIIDQNSLPNRDNIIKLIDPNASTNLAVFDLFGYNFSNPNEVRGTFVQDFSLKTSVTPQLASMITIGATSQGYVVGSDSTALSRLNRGLEDRIKSEVVDANYSDFTSSLDNTFTTFKNQAASLSEYIKICFSTSDGLPKLPSELTNDITTTLRNTIESGEAYYSISQSLSNADNASNLSGFLPFNLSLTIDGLSGMKVYQKFTVSNEYLPSNYPQSLEFIITSLTNTIQNNKWTTQIESLALPKVTTQNKLSLELLPSLTNILSSIPENATGLFINFTPKSNVRVNVNSLQVSENAISLIKYYEGIVIDKKTGASLPYFDDFAKIWTIGYGTTEIKNQPVNPYTTPVTEPQAANLLLNDVKSKFEPAVKRSIKVPLTQNEFDALIVFTYNVGQGNMSKSTLVSLINQKKYIEAANEFLKWANSKGVPVPGLLRRRRNEKYLFEKDSPGNI
jgi:lysozyme